MAKKKVKDLTKKEEIANKIQKLSGKYSPEEVFSDWVACSSLAFQNSLSLFHNEIWQKREEQYVNIAKKYSKEEFLEFIQMLHLLTEIFEEEISDVLGDIYMKAGCGNKRTGQFFTPFHLSKLTAETVIGNRIFSEDEKIQINEPSVGGGGMIIAYAAVLYDRGMNYQKMMKVTAQDLDWRSVYMTHLQLSLLGIDAIVMQGDTLREPTVTDEVRIFRTPKNMGILL